MGFQITIDAKSPSRLASFWAQALLGYEVRPYDETEIKRLASLGLSPETDTSVPIDGDGPTIWFQKCDDVACERNRIHLDVAYSDRQIEAKRLIELGATVREEHEDYIVMLDPEGNQFCLFDP